MKITYRYSRGFNLVEMMITLVVASVLISLAIPSFTDISGNNRLSTVANELIGVFTMARSEAVKRNRVVSVCTSVDGDVCEGSPYWEDGWIVFVDEDNDGLRGADELIVRVHAGIDDATVRSSFGDSVSFASNGASNSMGDFAICSAQGFDETSRAININATGRVKAGVAISGGFAVSTCNP